MSIPFTWGLGSTGKYSKRLGTVKLQKQLKLFLDPCINKNLIFRPYERVSSPRRSRSRIGIADEAREVQSHSRSLSRGRSKSTTRVVYDAEAIRTNGKFLLFQVTFLLKSIPTEAMVVRNWQESWCLVIGVALVLPAEHNR